MGYDGSTMRFAFVMALATSAHAQPFVYYRGVVNAGSFLPAGLPNGAIARGSMFSVFGRNLGPSVPQQAAAFPLTSTLAGVSVELTQGGTKVDAIPIFVSATQLNVVLPSNTPLGAVSLRVTYGGQTGNPIPMTVTPASVGLFSANGGGFGPGIVQNFVSQDSQPLNSLTATARPGQVGILWGTGIGAATFPDSAAPTVVTLDPNLEVFVGGKKAAVAYAGRAPCCASIDQIVFTVPADAPSGCYVPVVARSRGVVVSNTVTMAIHLSGGPCSDAHNPLNNQRGGGKTAFAQLARENLRVDVNVSQPFEATLDHLLASFRDHPASDFYFSALTAPPPLGSCTNYSGSASGMFTNNSFFAPPGAQVNPGGPLRVNSGSASVSVANTGGLDGTFYALLGAQNASGLGAPPSLLNSGSFTLAASVFSAALDNVSPMNWTNRDKIREVDRARDLLLTWSAVSEQSRAVMITGFAEQTPTNSVSGFVCIAAPGTTSFTVPAYVLMSLPPSDAASGATRISVVNAPLAGSFDVPGFDYSFLGVSSWSSKTAVTR